MRNNQMKLGRRVVRLSLVLAMMTGALLAGAGCGGGGGAGGGTTAADPSTSDPSSGVTPARGTSSTTGTGSAGSLSASSGATGGVGPSAPAASSSSGSATAEAAPAAGSASAGMPSAATGTAPAAPAAAPAAPAAPSAAPGVAGRPASGTIIPLYSLPSSGNWEAVTAAKRAHPSVPVLAVVNPNSGPGTAALSDYMAGIANLTAAGVKVIGYVATSYGKRPPAEIQADVDRWHNLYPAVTGIFFDEMTNTPGFEATYKNATGYAKSHGFDFTIGNPGADGGASYVGTVDTILIYENRGLPAVAALGGWHMGYDRHNFGVIPYGVGGVDAAFVKAATATCAYVYLSSDDLPNPWDTVPAYLDGLLAALASA